MKDTDKMPFGKHKGESMANVPASYLLWIKREHDKDPMQPQTRQQREVLQYVNDNIDDLKKEAGKQW